MQSKTTRRGFLEHCTAVSAAAMLSAGSMSSAAEQRPKTDWKAALHDPAGGLISGQPDLDQILALFPRTTGNPAFDPRVIAENIKKLQPVPAISTGHPFLDLSVKTGLAHIDATFRGDHPKYGVGTYAQDAHDGFPPTIIAAVDALSAWGMNRRAAELFHYWLTTFVREDGTIKYYGPSISEYGQLLHTAALLEQRAGAAGWWAEGYKALDRMAEFLLRLRAEAANQSNLIAGVPEADTRKDVARYFHNNAWAAKGLRRWADLCERPQGIADNDDCRDKKSRRGTGGRYPRRGPQGVARRPGRLVVVAASRAGAKTGKPHGLQDRLLHQLPLLARAALQRAAASGTGQPGRRGTTRGRRAVLWHDAVRRPPGRLAAG